MYYDGSYLTFFGLKETDDNQYRNRDSRVVIRIKLIARESIGCQDKFGIRSFLNKECCMMPEKKSCHPIIDNNVIYVSGYVFVIFQNLVIFPNFRMLR